MSEWTIEKQEILKDGRTVARLIGSGSSSFEDSLCRLNDHLYEWTRTFYLNDQTDSYPDFCMGLELSDPEDFYMIPCVNYNGNRWGDGKEPKGLEHDGIAWDYAWHRSGVPSGMYCQNEDLALGVFDSTRNLMGSRAVLSRTEDGNLRMCILFPEEEHKVYCARDRYAQDAFRENTVIAGDKISFKVCIVVAARSKKYDYGIFLDAAWRYFSAEEAAGHGTCGSSEATRQDTAGHGVCGSSEATRQDTTRHGVCKPSETPAYDAARLWDLGINFVTRSAWFEQGAFSGFCMGLTWKDGRWDQVRDHLEIGWVGQNASLAVSLLYDGFCCGREEHVQMGLKALDCWASQAVLPNGLVRVRFDRIPGALDACSDPSGQTVGQVVVGDAKTETGQKNTDQADQTAGVYGNQERNDAANLYSAVEEFLDAWKILKENGIERPQYREIALGICRFMVTHQAADGKLAKAWYNDGSISDPDGIVGSYMTQALCIGYLECRESAMLEAAVRSYDAYYKEFLSQGFTTAGALDTYCIDKEAAIPLLWSSLSLYDITGDRSYIEKAEQVSDYLATWQYHYNVRFPQRSVLGQIGYRTRGGTAVSVQHQHIDCYGLAFYEAWLRLADLTGKEIWRERAREIWQAALQNISDGSLVIKGQRRPAGSQDEGFLQTRWHTRRGDYFGVSEWLVVWNSAFRLKILRSRMRITEHDSMKHKDHSE